MTGTIVQSDMRRFRLRPRDVRMGPVHVPVPLLCLIWGTTVIVGLLVSIDYETRPARNRNSPANWPATVTLTRNVNQPVLLMFVHPHCPCSRASLTELAELREQLPPNIKIHVLFFDSQLLLKSPQTSSTWRQAQSIPDVAVGFDSEGYLSRQFGADTSGTVVVYDADGRLKFSGGITASRGHVGSNPGSAAVVEAVRGHHPESRCHCVFGCSISDLSKNGTESVR